MAIGAFTADMLKVLQVDMRRRWDETMIQALTMAPSRAVALEEDFVFCNSPTPNLPPLASIPIRRSSLFPFDAKCSTCGGTGEGETSTYCQECRGAGVKRIIGHGDLEIGRAHV